MNDERKKRSHFFKILASFFKANSNSAADPQWQEELKHTAQHLRATRQQLQKKSPAVSISVQQESLAPGVQKNRKNNKKPWILLLGPPQSGKTQLAAHAELSLQSVEHNQLGGSENASYPEAWYCEQGVVVDVPGRYLEIEPYSSFHYFWSTLIQQLKKYSLAPVPFHGILYAIDIDTLFDPFRFNQHLNQFKKLVLILKNLAYPIPVTLIVTQCDVIAGFKEFFNELSSEERKQTLGFALQAHPNAESNADLFTTQFQTFLKRLSDRTLWRLRHEPNLGTRSLIKDIPMQFELLSAPLQQWVSQIPWNKNFILQGVYFVSSLQQKKSFNYWHAHMPTVLQSALTVTATQSNRPPVSKPYFIADLLKEIFDPQHGHIRFSQPIKQSRQWVLLVMSMLVGVCGMVWVMQFYHQKHLLQALQIIANQTTQAKTKPWAWLTQLNDLQKIQHILKQESGGINFGFKQLPKLEQQANELYQKILHQSLLTYLDQQFSAKWQRDMNAPNPEQLFQDLKIYTQLTQQSHQQIPELQAWFQQQLLDETLDNTVKLKLFEHFSKLLQQAGWQWPTHSDFVEKGHAILKQLPIPEIIWIVLKDQYPQTDMLVIPKNANDFQLGQLEIPSVFMLKSLPHFYSNVIPQLVKSLTASQGLLGGVVGDTTPEQIDKIIADVQTFYLQKDADFWQSVLSQTQIPKLSSNKQILAVIQQFRDPKSVINQWILAVTSNTLGSVPSIPTFQTLVSSKFSALNNLSSSPESIAFQQGLTILQPVLENFIQAPDPYKAAYDFSIERMQQPVVDNNPIHLTQNKIAQLPQPFQSWLQQLSQTTWKQTLVDTQYYLNRIWMRDVIPQYQTSIDQRYPLYKSATQEINLNDFTQFFGPNGTLDSFFNYYLKPFVDSSQFYWKWKLIDGQGVAISQNSLEMFIRANLLKQMFFPSDSGRINVHFTLIPVGLSNQVSLFKLNVDGQMVQFQPNSQEGIQITWPGPTPGIVTLQFADNKGNNPTWSQSGAWAWFRLLDQSILKVGSSTKQYDLTFQQGDDQAHYQLIANELANPFIPGVLDAFRCPKVLE